MKIFEDGTPRAVYAFTAPEAEYGPNGDGIKLD